ncbi:MAG: hypothetical protein WCI18_10630 [Pseudomonadota bacterium]
MFIKMTSSVLALGLFSLSSSTAFANWGDRYHKKIEFPASTGSQFLKLECDFYNSRNQANDEGQITAKQFMRQLDRFGERVVWTSVTDTPIEIPPVVGRDALYSQDFVALPQTHSEKPKHVYSVSHGEYAFPDTQTILLDEENSRKNASFETEALIKYIDSVCPF